MYMFSHLYIVLELHIIIYVHYTFLLHEYYKENLLSHHPPHEHVKLAVLLCDSLETI